MKKPICPYIVTDSSTQMQRTVADACSVVTTIVVSNGARVCLQLIATVTADDSIDGPMSLPCIQRYHPGFFGTKSCQCSAARSCWCWCCWAAKTSLTSCSMSHLALSLC